MRAPDGSDPAPLLTEIGRLTFDPPLDQMPLWRAMRGTSGVAYVSTGDAILVLDARTGALLEEMRDFSFMGPDYHGTSGIAIAEGDAGRKLLVEFSGEENFAVYDLSTPAHPVFEGPAPALRGYALLPLPGGRCALAWNYWEGVAVVDLATRSVVSRLGFTQWYLQTVGVGGNAESPRIALRSSGRAGESPTFDTWDLTNPASPVHLATAPAADDSGAMFIDRSGTVLVQPVGTHLALFDFASGAPLSTFDVDGEVLEGGRAVLAEGGGVRVLALALDSSVALVDLADPASPRLAGSIPASVVDTDIYGRDYVVSRSPLAASPTAPLLVIASPRDHGFVIADVRDGSILSTAPTGGAQPAVPQFMSSPSEPSVMLFALRVSGGEVLVPGGLAEISFADISDPDAPVVTGAYAPVTPGRSGQELTTTAGRFVVSWDPTYNAVTVVDAATASVAATGGATAPSTRSYPGGVFATGRTIVVTLSDGSEHRPGAEAFDLVDGALVSRGPLRPPSITFGGAAVRDDGLVIALFNDRLLLQRPDGSVTEMPLDRDFSQIELHPSGRFVLLTQNYGRIWDPWPIAVVDITDTNNPRLLWRVDGTSSTAMFTRGGDAVQATFEDWDTMGFHPVLYDTMTGAPLGPDGDRSDSFFYHGPGVAFGVGEESRVSLWHWTWTGWQTVIYDTSQDSPALLGQSDEYFDPPYYAPRAGTATCYELRPSCPASDLVLDHADGTFEARAPIDAANLFALRRGFLAGMSVRSPRDLVLFRDPELNSPPVAAPGPDREVECTGPSGALVELDGRASTDPDSTPGAHDDLQTFSWSADGAPIGDGETTSAQLSLGLHAVTLAVTDKLGLSDSATAQVSVLDTTPPAGGITFPEPGQCFGPDATPVTLADDMADLCSAEITRSYDPPGGPSYATHGDHHVTLAAADASGNVASAHIDFTIDLTSPTVQILNLASGRLNLPTALPMALVFTTSDDDGATGGVVHEVIELQDRPGGQYCTLYDGWKYGDNDGLLSDENLALSVDELCRLARLCGFTTLSAPELRVEAEDCGSNVGSDARRLNGGLALWPGLCTASSHRPDRSRTSPRQPTITSGRPVAPNPSGPPIGP